MELFLSLTYTCNRSLFPTLAAPIFQGGFFHALIRSLALVSW